jgi:hypothetical protein
MKPVTQENNRLLFVGIGYMGRPIGFKLTAYDRNHSKAEEHPLWKLVASASVIGR